MQSFAAPKARRRRVLACGAGLLAGLMLGLGLAVAAAAPGLTWPWLGGSGGSVEGSGVELSAVIGQAFAGDAGGAFELCVGAGCADGLAAAAPTPATEPTASPPAPELQIMLPWIQQDEG